MSHKIRQNIYVSIGAKSVILALSLMGRTGLWEAVIADVGTALAVILNGMTMLNRGPKISQKVDRKTHAQAMQCRENGVQRTKTNIFFDKCAFVRRCRRW